jgi:16S rRNA pseudouridine516 synthase
MMRLDRILANARIGTRSQVKKIVKAGRVKVNGAAAPSSDIRIDENTAEIEVDGMPVVYAQYVYYMLNKPAGYITATEGSVPIVMDLIHEDARSMFPVGRLDKDTTGLLLITNDGPLAHELLSPKKHVDKEYMVRLAHEVSEEDMQKIAAGIRFEGEEYKPAVYKKISDTSGSIILKEGKYHEIKLIFKALGNHVEALQRIRMKNLILDPSLKEGEYRSLSEEELADLRSSLQPSAAASNEDHGHIPEDNQ